MRKIITNYRLLGLLLSNVSTLFVGMSLFPIFPHYAAELGAGPGAIGVSFAIIYVASALGPIALNLLLKRFSRKAIFLVIGVSGPPSIVLLGLSSTLWQVVALMSVAWFCGGITITLVNVFTGVYADPSMRGRAYTVIGLAPPIGALLGGSVTSQILARFDFMTACFVMAAVWSILPIAGLFILDARSEPGVTSRKASATQLGPAFALLMVTCLIALAAVNTGRLGISLVMETRGFTAADVAASSGISGLTAIPLILLFGMLADRFGRQPALILSYLTIAAGLATLALAVTLWQFALAATLVLTAYCTANSLGAALGADLVAPEALGSAMARLNITTSLGGVLCFVAAGYAFAAFGPIQLCAGAAALGLVAAGLALFLRQRRRIAGVTVATV